jgi:hypothetical protein
MRQDAWAHVDNGEIRYRSHTFVIGKCQTSWRTTPVTILDRETVELIEDALDGCITMGVPEKDAKIQAALKAVRDGK